MKKAGLKKSLILFSIAMLIVTVTFFIKGGELNFDHADRGSWREGHGSTMRERLFAERNNQTWREYVLSSNTESNEWSFALWCQNLYREFSDGYDVNETNYGYVYYDDSGQVHTKKRC